VTGHSQHGQHDRGTVRPYGDAVAKRKGAHCRWTELSSAELYDPNAGHSHRRQHDPGADGHTATLLQNGKVLIAGTGTPDMSAELYDQWPGRLEVTGTMTVTGLQHTATLLNNGWCSSPAESTR